MGDHGSKIQPVLTKFFWPEKHENFLRDVFFCHAHKTRFHDCSPVLINYHFAQEKKQFTKPR